MLVEWLYYWSIIVTSFVAAMAMEAPKRAITMSCFIVNYIFVTWLKLCLCRISQLSPLCDISLKIFHNCHFGDFSWTQSFSLSDILSGVSCTLSLVDWLLHLLWLAPLSSFNFIIRSSPFHIYASTKCIEGIHHCKLAPKLMYIVCATNIPQQSLINFLCHIYTLTLKGL